MFLSELKDKLKILRLAREKKELMYQGSRVFIYPDFSYGLTQKRRLFDPVKKKLREMGIRYALLYPSTLRIHIGDEDHLCNSPEEAEAKVLRQIWIRPGSGRLQENLGINTDTKISVDAILLMM
ncbi:unnamed protein product [Leuciscus chuanchicus]